VTLAIAFELRQRGFAHVVGGGFILAGRGGGNLRGDFFHADEHVGDLRLAFLFFVARPGEIAVIDVALFLGGLLRETGFDAMMIGEDQAITGHERRGAV
jgi:hypothetical protein